jgi:hypothetical protein
VIERVNEREQTGTYELMTDEERARTRAKNLLPEEQSAGSDDPEGQAASILSESDARQQDRSAAPGTVLEHRRSEETVEPSE